MSLCFAKSESETNSHITRIRVSNVPSPYRPAIATSCMCDMGNNDKARANFEETLKINQESVEANLLRADLAKLPAKG